LTTVKVQQQDGFLSSDAVQSMIKIAALNNANINTEQSLLFEQVLDIGEPGCGVDH